MASLVKRTIPGILNDIRAAQQEQQIHNCLQEILDHINATKDNATLKEKTVLALVNALQESKVHISMQSIANGRFPAALFDRNLTGSQDIAAVIASKNLQAAVLAGVKSQEISGSIAEQQQQSKERLQYIMPLEFFQTGGLLTADNFACYFALLLSRAAASNKHKAELLGKPFDITILDDRQRMLNYITSLIDDEMHLTMFSGGSQESIFQQSELLILDDICKRIQDLFATDMQKEQLPTYEDTDFNLEDAVRGNKYLKTFEFFIKTPACEAVKGVLGMVNAAHQRHRRNSLDAVAAILSPSPSSGSIGASAGSSDDRRTSIGSEDHAKSIRKLRSSLLASHDSSHASGVERRSPSPVRGGGFCCGK